MDCVEHMRILVISLSVLVLASFLLVPIAPAHSPLSTGNNESIATATIVSDPTKSWAIYSELHEGGEAQYYRLEMAEGQRIHVSLLTSTGPENTGFTPGVVLMGPGITSQGTVPEYVEVPEGVGSMVVEGKQPAQATYEAFSPSNFYSLADLELDAPASSTYYVAVYEPSRGGRYSIAVGDREASTISEYILIPINLIPVYQWEGQSLALVLAPMGITIAVGLMLMVWRWRNQGTPQTPSGWVGASAGLLFLGTGATVLFQMVFSLTRAPVTPEIGITLVFSLMPILLGIGVLRIVLSRGEKVKTRTRIYLAILGIIALFAWAGLLVGPALALVASVLPSRASEAKPR